MGVEKNPSSCSQQYFNNSCTWEEDISRDTAEGEISGQNGWGKPKTSPQTERHGGETSSQSLPQKYVRTHRGGQEPDSKTEPKQQMWRYGNTRRSGSRAGHHKKEVPLPPDGGHHGLVSVQNEGVRRCSNQRLHTIMGFWQGCALIHNFFPNAFDYKSLKTESPGDRKRNFELAFTTGEKFAGVPDFLTAEDMSGMVEERRIDPKMVFSYVQEVYRMCNEL